MYQEPLPPESIKRLDDGAKVKKTSPEPRGDLDAVSESRAKKRAHSIILERCPFCVYCGGSTLATTVDHVPPIGMFRRRQRPKGLEFGSCLPCNGGTRLADLVAALLCRTYPDADGANEKDELERLLASVNNNVPGLLQEMHIGRGGQKIARNRLPVPTGAGFLRTNGPLVSNHMQTFATKLGFAFYHELTQSIIPPSGGVVARWFSNVDRLEGKFPQTIFDVLLPAQTLRQGRFEVSSQFAYQWRLSEGERMGLFCAFFGQSFAVVVCAATDQSLLAIEAVDQDLIVHPGKIRRFLQGEVGKGST